MKLQEIEIKNFGVFYHTATLTLHSKPNKNICYVDGQNGYGKTTLQASIKYAMYGFDDPRHLFNSINRHARRESDFDMSVRLSFTHDGKNMQLTRSVTPKTNKTANSYRDLDEQITLIVDGTVKKNPDDYLNEILPKDASQFFFFDGEKIERYTEELQDPEDTKAAIELVLEIPAIRNGKEDLSDLQRDLEKDYSSELAKAIKKKDLDAKIQALTIEVGLQKTVYDNAEKNLKDCAEELRKVEDELTKNEIANDILNKKAANKRELDSLNTQLEETRDRQLHLVSSIPYLVIKAEFQKRLTKANKDIAEARSKLMERNRIEGTVDVLRQSIDRGECFCGNKIGAAETVFLERNLKNYTVKLNETKEVQPDYERESRLTKVEALLNSIQSDEIRTLQERLIGLLSDIDDLETKNQSLEKKLNELPIAETERLRKRRSELLEEMQKQRDAKTQAETIIQMKQEEKDALEREARKFVAVESDEFNAVEKQLQIVRNTVLALDELITRTIEEKRKKIEDEATSVFKKLTGKPDSYDHLQVSDDYALNIINKRGEVEDRSRISAGEKQILAFSFIAGLARTSRQEAPVIMDTPFGRLDKTHKTNVVKYLKNLASQVMILATDEDIDQEYLDMIEPNISDKYKLVFDSKTLSSKLVSV